MTLAQRNRLRLVLAAALTILTVVTLLFRQWLAPVAEELMAAQVNNEASDAVNAAIDKQIAAGELSYDKLVVIEKDAAGNVTAIRSNMAEIWLRFMPDMDTTMTLSRRDRVLMRP